jgi:peroxiredoxin
MRFYMLFVIPLIAINWILAGWTGFRLLVSGGEAVWLGAFIASAALPANMVVFNIAPATSRSSARLPVTQAITFLGFALVVAADYQYWKTMGVWQVVPLAMAAASVAILLWFVLFQGEYGRRSSGALQIGKQLPRIPLTTLDGMEISSDNFRGAKTLIIFFRANWCPLCVAQLKEVRARADRLAKASVAVKFVTNQPVVKSQELAKQLQLPPHFEILHDRDLRAARKLSIVDEGGTLVTALSKGFPRDTVMATVIALDEEGRIIFGDETHNYRRRPHPDSFIPILER